MQLTQSDLILVWLGGGFALFLAWVAIVGEVLIHPESRLIRPAMCLLALVGLIQPVAAVATVDLVRLAGTSPDDAPVAPGTDGLDDADDDDRSRRGTRRQPPLDLPSWAGLASILWLATSIVIATSLWFQVDDVL